MKFLVIGEATYTTIPLMQIAKAIGEATSWRPLMQIANYLSYKCFLQTIYHTNALTLDRV